MGPTVERLCSWGLGTRSPLRGHGVHLGACCAWAVKPQPGSRASLNFTWGLAGTGGPRGSGTVTRGRDDRTAVRGQGPGPGLHLQPPKASLKCRPPVSTPEGYTQWGAGRRHPANAQEQSWGWGAWLGLGGLHCGWFGLLGGVVCLCLWSLFSRRQRLGLKTCHPVCRSHSFLNLFALSS